MENASSSYIWNKNPSLQGFPLEIFPENIDQKFCCGICFFILRQPLQSYCGHRFCKACFQNFLQETSGDLICRLCKEEDGSDNILSADQAFPDNAIRREFNQLQVKCSFHGCDWSGAFKDFEAHFDACQFFRAQCEVCGKMVSKEECSTHWPCKSQKCPFGCEQLIEPETLEQHLKDSLDVHFLKIQEALKRLQESFGNEAASPQDNKTISERIEFIGRLLSEINEQMASGDVRPIVAVPVLKIIKLSLQSEKALSTNNDKMIILEGIITVFSRELEKLSEQVEGITTRKKQDKDSLESIDRKAQQVDVVLKLKEATMADIGARVSAVEDANYDGTLTWKITDFQRRRQEAISGRTTSLYSPTFYTSRTGYKMCARIYLNGDGMGKGTHVSLFFVIMRGQYDALLPWPFRHKVTMMLLDQNNREHAIDAFRPDPTSSSFKMPTTDMNIASGCPMFMTLAQLDSPSHAYVKEDAAFVKILINLDDSK